MEGRFITFEGLEGSGKSTQSTRVRDWMEELGLPVLWTQEPGGSELGRRIREILLAPDGEELDSMAELFLFEADRAQHVSRLVRPALEQGTHVLCDRFTDSTIAYQAFGRRLPLEMIRRLNDRATGGLTPDLTLLFQVDPGEGLRRVRRRSDGDRFEREDIAFHRRIWKGYRELSRQEPERFHLLPEGTIEEVFELVRAAVSEVLDGVGVDTRPKGGGGVASA